MQLNRMRRGRIKKLILAAVLALAVGPAWAQFMPPGGGYAPSYTITAPEAATGVLGASSAGSAAGETTCYQQYYGRSGSRTHCEPPAPAPGNK
jgi:hypothetical protein